MGERKIKAGVIGWPIAHSLSPFIFSYWLKKYSIAGSYETFSVDQKSLGEILYIMEDAGLTGLNVTVPHKQTVMEYLDNLSDRARRIGAVNTITLQKNGMLSGDNTDGFGFIENLKQNYKGSNVFSGVSIVIGAGGAARAIISALIDVGSKKIRVFNRTRNNAEKIAEEINGPIDVLDWNERHASLEDATLLVNATTSGMINKQPLDLDLNALPQKALVNDIVYAPIETQLLINAKARGNPTVDGIGMLLHQARPAFAAWFGKEPEVTEDLRRYVLNINKR